MRLVRGLHGQCVTALEAVEPCVLHGVLDGADLRSSPPYTRFYFVTFSRSDEMPFMYQFSTWGEFRRTNPKRPDLSHMQSTLCQ